MLSFPRFMFLPLGHRLTGLMSVGFLLSAPLCPMMHVSAFVPVHAASDCCSFVVQFEIRECDTPSFVLLSQDHFGYWGTLSLHTNFRIICPHSVQNARCILIEIALNL